MSSPGRVAIVTMILSSGCLGGGGTTDGPADPNVPLAVPDDMGALAGTVVDDETKPVAGASLGLQGLDLEAKSQQDGSFRLAPLAPGAYVLFVQRIGFEEGVLKVDIVAGETTRLTVVLRPRPVIIDHVAVFGPYVGHLSCGFVTPNVPGFFEGITVDCSGVGTPASQIEFKVVLEEPYRNIVGETKWQSSTATSARRLQTFLEADPDEALYCSASGSSPTKFRYSRQVEEQRCHADLERTDEEMPPVKEVLLSTYLSYADVANTTSPRAADAALDQRFELIASVFYGAPASDDYSAFPDG